MSLKKEEPPSLTPLQKSTIRLIKRVRDKREAKSLKGKIKKLLRRIKMSIISNDKVYDTLKWLTLTVFPALLTFYGLVANTLGLPYVQEVLTIGAGFITFLGIILGVSNAQYKAENK